MNMNMNNDINIKELKEVSTKEWNHYPESLFISGWIVTTPNSEYKVGTRWISVPQKLAIRFYGGIYRMNGVDFDIVWYTKGNFGLITLSDDYITGTQEPEMYLYEDKSDLSGFLMCAIIEKQPKHRIIQTLAGQGTTVYYRQWKNRTNDVLGYESNGGERKIYTKDKDGLAESNECNDNPALLDYVWGKEGNCDISMLSKLNLRFKDEYKNKYKNKSETNNRPTILGGLLIVALATVIVAMILF